MCLSVPGKIISIKEDTATLDYGVEKRKAKLISDDFKIGDYAIVQGGILVIKVDKKEAIESLKLYQESFKD